jgi:hypothetical protein
MLKKQNNEFIDKSINSVFHFLELKHSHNFLIGSNSIRNLLYSNDYDLNTNIKISDSIQILNSLYKEFLNIFHKAYKNNDIWIIDFKNGYYNNEPIRWSYNDMIKGKKYGLTFQECLLHDDNIIKMDICYLYNDIFTDINCVYMLYIVNKKEQYEEKKKQENKEIKRKLKDEINELIKNKEFYKAMKRSFSLSIYEGKLNKEILKIMNSDYGMFYKFISFLKLVYEMLEQNFKPIQISLIKSNLEYIKMFGSHITKFIIDKYLNMLIKIINLNDKSIMKKKLDKLIKESSYYLDMKINKEIQTFS